MSWKAFYILKIASLLWRRRCWWAIYRNVPFALDFLIRKRSMWVLKMITMWPEDGWLCCPRSIVLSDATSRVVLASELALASASDTRTVPEWGLHRGTIRLKEAVGVSQGWDLRQCLPEHHWLWPRALPPGPRVVSRHWGGETGRDAPWVIVRT